METEGGGASVGPPTREGFESLAAWQRRGKEGFESLADAPGFESHAACEGPGGIRIPGCLAAAGGEGFESLAFWKLGRMGGGRDSSH